MQTNLYQLYNRKLNGLTVFRALLEDVLIQRLQKLLRACEESDAETLTCTYGAFTSALFEKNVNFSEALLELVLADENRFLLSAARKEVCPPAICDAAKRELDFFTELAGLSAKAIKTILPEEIAAFLPDWETTALDFYTAYTKHIADAPKKGIHFPPAVDVQNIFPGPDQMEMESVGVGRFHQQPRAEGAEVGVQAMHRIIKIRVVQRGLHGLSHFVQPGVEARNSIGGGMILERQPKPGTHGAGHASLHPGRQRAHSQNARAVHQTVVELGPFMRRIVAVRAPAARQEQFRQGSPCRVPSGSLAAQRLVAALDRKHVKRHALPQRRLARVRAGKTARAGAIGHNRSGQAPVSPLPVPLRLSGRRRPRALRFGRLLFRNGLHFRSVVSSTESHNHASSS